jgi:hypothetical protein
MGKDTGNISTALQRVSDLGINGAQFLLRTIERTDFNMDERVEDAFLTQTFVQCEIALTFASDIKHAVLEKEDLRIWCAIQGFLASTANISKMLWPSRRGKTEAMDRGERLRALLSVSDIEILKDRKFRDHFEHFDERLDAWAEGHSISRTGLLDGWIAYSKVNFDMEKPGLLRIFHAPDLTVTFCGERYPLEPVIEAIERLQVKVQAEARQRQEKRLSKRSNAST